MRMLNEVEVSIVAGGHNVGGQMRKKHKHGDDNTGEDNNPDGQNAATDQAEAQQGNLCYQPGASTTCAVEVGWGPARLRLEREIDDRDG